MRSVCSLALAALVLAAAFARAEERPPIWVTDPGEREYKAAIQRFSDRRAVPQLADGTSLRGDIRESVDFSPLFESLDPKAFLGPDESQALDAPQPPVCSQWSDIGADALVEGEIRSGSQGVVVEFRIWDVARCRGLLRKRYFGAQADLPIIARRIADDVVREFTGASGVSSTEIAFISDRSGRKEVYVMNSDGTGVRAATRNRSINAFPGWAPNGDEVVYTSYRHGGQPTLFTISRGGRRKPGRLLTRINGKSPIYRGVFTPDGKRLAFVMSVDGAPEIFTSRPDGRSRRRLTEHSAIDISPSYSPDGSRMAFVSDRSGSPQLYLMDADGNNPRRLTFQGAYNTGPAWSPDGRWIAYESRVGAQFDVWIIDPEGQVNEPIVTHPRSDESPSWAPDGRSLAFSSNRRGTADIYTIGLDGRNLRRLTASSGNNTSPAWGPFPGKR